MSGLDGEWAGQASEAIVITVPLAVDFLASADDNNRQAIIDLVVGQAARKAHEAVMERIG